MGDTCTSHERRDIAPARAGPSIRVVPSISATRARADFEAQIFTAGLPGSIHDLCNSR